MLAGLTTLLLFQCAGEVLVRALRLPFPGPVLGMLLLLIALLVRGRGLPAGLHEAGHGILRHLSLLFLPAGVGVMLYYRSLTASPASMLVVLVVSTVATIAATALTIQWLSHRTGGSRHLKSETAESP
jgi:holin-like protein